MKKISAVFISVLMIFMSLTACGSNEPEAEINASQAEETSGGFETASTLDGVSYVMIYNPYIYSEGNQMELEKPAIMSTGDFSSQIVAGMNRAGNLGTEIEVPVTWSQAEINQNVDTSGVNREGVRGEAMDPVYTLNEKHAFFHTDSSMMNNIKDEFQCYYVGEHCYIWSLNGSISEADAKMMGQEFDTNIYKKDVEAFGPARFTDNGGKVNLLFYPMQEGIGGFFTTADIYSSAELPASMAESRGFNTDHAIVHINSTYVTANPDYAKSTMTHELQHLICASGCFNYKDTPMMKTWLNEAMSAYAEEMVYPGIKESGYYNQFYYLSNNFRTGQSLYNFETEGDDYIGAYGAVYLFSKHMEQIAGTDVFKNVHDYWRNSYSATVTEAEALANAVPSELYEEINSKYGYPEAVTSGFTNEHEEWMSKLALDFFIETVSMDLANLENVKEQALASMLYSEINPVDIEGGGRIMIATQNEVYDIPEDADPNLIYVGFDKNFELVNIYTAQ